MLRTAGRCRVFAAEVRGQHPGQDRGAAAPRKYDRAYWSALDHATEAVVIAISPAVGWITWWWLVAAGAALLVSCAVGFADVAGAQHRQARAAGITLAVVTVLLPLVAFSVLSAWFLIAVIIGWIAATALATDTYDTQTSKAAA